MTHDDNIKQEARKYVKQNQKAIISQFISPTIYQPTKNPVSFFMAGSPGAGKTEYSKSFIKLSNQAIQELSGMQIAYPIIRIDPDEMRAILPGYNGQNAHLFQEAAVLAVNKLYDYALKNNLNILLDGTFSNLDYAREDINRAIKKGREISIFYIYQDPLLAWQFTLKREKLECRKITLDIFVNGFFQAKSNVDIIKQEFGDKVRIDLVKKNFDNNVEKVYFNINDSIDNYINADYNRQALEEKLKIIKI